MFGAKGSAGTPGGGNVTFRVEDTERESYGEARALTGLCGAGLYTVHRRNEEIMNEEMNLQRVTDIQRFSRFLHHGMLQTK